MHSEHSNGSEWAHRRGRRLAAAARDEGRLDARLVSIEAALRELGAQVGATFDLMKTLPDAVHVPPGLESARQDVEVGEVRRRLEKVEILLFRTSLLEWRALDNEIVALLPKLVAAPPRVGPPLKCEMKEGEGESTGLTAASCGRKLQRQDDSWASTIASAADVDVDVVQGKVKQVAATAFFTLARDDEEVVGSAASIESVDAECPVGSVMGFEAQAAKTDAMTMVEAAERSAVDAMAKVMAVAEAKATQEAVLMLEQVQLAAAKREADAQARQQERLAAAAKAKVEAVAEAKAKQEAEEESARMRAEQETAAMMAARVAAVEGDAKVARCVDGVLAARGKIEFGTALAALIAARSRCWHDNGWEAWPRS